jgi:hypothetical protein
MGMAVQPGVPHHLQEGGAEPRQLLLRHASQSSLDESSQKIGGKVIIILTLVNARPRALVVLLLRGLFHTYKSEWAPCLEKKYVISG